MNFDNLTTEEFVNWMKENGSYQGYIFNIDGNISTSSDSIEGLSNYICNLPDYSKHEAIIFKYDEQANALFTVAVHQTNRGPAQGGTRFKNYNLISDLFIDAIRLSKGMTEKISLAELWWGGGKSIIHPLKPLSTITTENREIIFKKFGLFIASLKGLYVAAEDMNTTPEDMRIIHTYNRFCTCIPSDIGGSSNPSKLTAKGVFKGMLAGIHFLEGKNDPKDTNLTGKNILIEGAGNVGYTVLEQVVNSGGKVYLYEIDSNKIKKIKSIYNETQVKVIEDLDVFYSIEADVFSPNAIGATVNEETIKKLNVKIIAGSANNQLKKSKENTQMLHEKGILYIPDFVINAMGIINCANEQYGYILEEIEDRLETIYPRIYELLTESKKSSESPQSTAIKKSEELSKINHLILGHRGKKILKHLMRLNNINNTPQRAEG